MSSIDQNIRPSSPLDRRAAWLAALITLAYALLAFWNLGSTQVPKTWVSPAHAGDSFIVDLGGDRTPDRLYLYTGVGDGRYQVDISADGRSWAPLAEAKRQGPFIWSWSVIKIAPPATGALHGRWLRWTVTAPGEMLFEIAVTQAGSQIPLEGLSVSPVLPLGLDPAELAKLVDEPHSFIYYPDPAHDMVFDEVYHARTAWEHLNRLEPYEWTHPPLGKIILAGGVALFGMDPFGWRLPPLIFGVAMLPLIYWMGRRLFGNPAWALAAQLLFALDFMHFTESRLGVVDSFMVFFVMLMVGAFWRWYSLMGEGQPRPAQPWLLLSGLGLALGASTKWNALYPGLAMAVLFAVAVIGYWRRQTAASRPADPAKAPRQPAAKALAAKTAAQAQNDKLAGRSPAGLAAKPSRSWLPATLAVALLSFIILPLAVYLASYIPYFQVPGHQGGLGEVWEWQHKMYSYHAELNVAHDFASPWWQWPLMIKPLWAYTARDTMPPGITATVAAFGNPAIWWLGFPAIAGAAVLGIMKRDRVLVFLLAILLSQYLPWIVAPRKVTFIYHFFPMVPTLVLLIVRILQVWWESRRARGLPMKPLKLAYGIYFGLAIALFLAFYPVISGATVSVAWVNALRWLPGWYF